MKVKQIIGAAALLLIMAATITGAVISATGDTKEPEEGKRPGPTISLDTTAPPETTAVQATDALEYYGPYYDEVTDPDFHGYPEIDHSAVPCPITEEEVVMLAKTMYQEAQVVYWDGTKWGVSYKARQAAVAWVALNRLDRGTFGDSLEAVLTAPAQFAYYPDTTVTEEMLALAQDVVGRWWREHQGEIDVGRVIPAEYFWFEGDGRENHFRATFEQTGRTWDWSLPDPYGEEEMQE